MSVFFVSVVVVVVFVVTAAVMTVLAPDNIPLDLCFQVGRDEEKMKYDVNIFPPVLGCWGDEQDNAYRSGGGAGPLLAGHTRR